MKKIEEDSDFFRYLVKEYDEFVIVSETDLNGIITYASIGFCNISGYTREELIGRSHNIIKDPNNSPDIFKKLWDDLKQDKIVQLELSNRAKDGSIYWVEAKVYPMFKGGKKIGYRALRKDITDKKKLELTMRKIEQEYKNIKISNEELSKANEILLKTTKILKKDFEEEKSKLKDNLVSTFTHELKTPLNGIINFANYIYKHLNTNLSEKKVEKLKSLADKIRRNGISELNMIENLLEISKYKLDNNLQINYELVTLDKVILSIIDKYQIDKQLILDLDNIKIAIDRKKFKIIIDNLLSNAIKYSKNIIKISLKSDDKFVIFIIEDDGDGIKDINKSKVFDLFEQLDDNYLNREATGTGAGLYIVKFLCHHLNCDIELKDSKLGGAKFIIKIKK